MATGAKALVFHTQTVVGVASDRVASNVPVVLNVKCDIPVGFMESLDWDCTADGQTA